MKRTYWIALVLGIVLLLLIAILARMPSAENEYMVIIHNKSPHELTDVRVFGGGCDEHLDNIVPDETVQHTFRIKQDGKLEFSARGDSINGPTTLSKVIDTQVNRDREGMSTVTVDSDGDVSAISEKGN